MSRARRLALGTMAAVLLVAAAALGVGYTRTRASTITGTSPSVPTATVSRGAIELTVHMKGDLRSARQQAIMAPAVGGALRILRALDTGAVVKEGDTLLEFDPADQLYALEQAESELREAEQEILKQRADSAAQDAQDKVLLLTAQFDVRRAELDAAVDKELIPANDYQIRQASLVEARRTLAQTEQDVRARSTAGKAGFTVLDEKRAKAALTADRARQNIESLVIKAPMDGVVSMRENTDAAGGVFFSGMTLPQYRVGDTVNPGRPVLDIFDVSRMEIRATVGEQERANVAVHEAVRVRSNAAPGAALDATITAISGLGHADRTAGPLRVFDVTLELNHADTRLRPGTSVDVTVPGKRVENVLLLPRQAIFEKDGRPVIYARTDAGFEPRTVKVQYRTESQVAVDGVAEGATVALVNPDSVPSAAPASTPAGPGLGR